MYLIHPARQKLGNTTLNSKAAEAAFKGFMGNFIYSALQTVKLIYKLNFRSHIQTKALDTSCLKIALCY